MRKFGGLRKVMPITHWTFLAGCLALAGLYPFSGFWSKDAILGSVRDQGAAMAMEVQKRPSLDANPTASSDSFVHLVSDTGGAHDHGPTTQHLGHLSTSLVQKGSTIYRVLYYLSLATAFLTAVYTFRMYFMTFFGDRLIPEEAGDHAHESPASMWIPLSILAGFAVAVGGALHFSGVFHRFLSFTPSLATGAMASTPQPGVFHMDVAIVSAVIAVVGVALATFLYLGRPNEAAGLAKLFSTPVLGAPYVAAKAKFFWDEIYDLLVVRPLRLLARFCYAVDQRLVDGLVNFVGWIPRFFGESLRGLQMGFIPFYALAMVLGFLTLTLVAARVLWGG